MTTEQILEEAMKLGSTDFCLEITGKDDDEGQTRTAQTYFGQIALKAMHAVIEELEIIKNSKDEKHSDIFQEIAEYIDDLEEYEDYLDELEKYEEDENEEAIELLDEVPEPEITQSLLRFPKLINLLNEVNLPIIYSGDYPGEITDIKLFVITSTSKIEIPYNS